MIRPTFRQAVVARVLSTLRVIWAAMVIGVLIDIALAIWITLRFGRMFPTDVAATLTPALYAVAVGIALLALWWRRVVGPDRCVAGSTGAASLPGLNVAPETDAERLTIGALARFRTHTIVSWALCAAIAITGLILSIGTGDARYVTGLAAASLVLLAMHMPSQRRVEAIVAAVPGA